MRQPAPRDWAQRSGGRLSILLNPKFRTILDLTPGNLPLAFSPIMGTPAEIMYNP